MPQTSHLPTSIEVLANPALTTWADYGLAGLIAVCLGGVIAYMFKLLYGEQVKTRDRLLAERNAFREENDALHERFERQQEQSLVILADVSKVLAEVKDMLKRSEWERRNERP